MELWQIALGISDKTDYLGKMRRGSRAPQSQQIFCIRCNGNLKFRELLESFLRCEDCESVKQILECERCGFRTFKCRNCFLKPDLSGLIPEKIKSVPPKSNAKTYGYKWIGIVIVIGAVLFLVFNLLGSYVINYSGEDKNTNNLLEELKIKYPSQKNDTWYHFLSVLESEVPSVKSITFLHDEEKTTSDCLTKVLISRFSRGKKIKVEEITFSEVGFEGVDYGLVLEHYHAIVKKYGVFRADLTEVSGKVARIFHSLCDEVSSDIKPSLFIFTMKDSKRNEKLKPLERATATLQQSWSDLPDSELQPLLSRVIKNVVEIIPERGSSCFSENDE